MYYSILDQKRINILPLLGLLDDKWYLAGGTALALQIGHRDSVDFDFFIDSDFDTSVLFERLREIFEDYDIVKIQDEKNTLTIILDEEIKLSFFTYKYKLLKSIIVEKYLRLASVKDIACMKLSAVVSRATQKDYVDLYFILQKISLDTLLKDAKVKFSQLDTNLILKSLIYFEDIKNEKIYFKNNKEINFEEVKKYLQNIVVQYETDNKKCKQYKKRK